MTTVYPLNNVFRRLLSWQRPAASAPELPAELILEEILSYFLDKPTTLAGMQVAFTSKEFYRRIRPVLTTFYVDNLVGAYGEGKLAAYDSPAGGIQRQTMSLSTFRHKVCNAFNQAAFSPTSDAPQGTSPFELSYAVHLGSFDDTNILWSLVSLLSLPHVGKHLRDFELTFEERDPAQDGEQLSATPSEEWRRAFSTALAYAATEPERVKVSLWRGDSTLPEDEPEEFLGCPLSFPSFLPHGCVDDLSLSGSILGLLGPSLFNSFLWHSSKALTRLQLCHCDPLNAKEWVSALGDCHIPFLQDFRVHDTCIPLDVLTSFCLSNPSITSAEILIPALSAFRPGARLQIRSEDRARFLPRLKKLAATTDFLLILFNHDATGMELEIPLFNLEFLHIVLELPLDQIRAGKVNYDDVTTILSRIPAPDDGAKHKSLIALRSIKLEIPYDRSATELWFASGYARITSMQSSNEGGFLSSLFDTAADFMQVSSTRQPPHLAHALASLTHVAAFHLWLRDPDDWTNAPPTYAVHPCTVVGFISALPRLEKVVLEGVFGRPREAVDNAEEFWGGLARVWSVCYNLNTLEIRGLGGSENPAVWNRGEDEPTPGIDAWALLLFA